jgi:tyrosine-protein phosphatase YwqE
MLSDCFFDYCRLYDTRPPNELLCFYKNNRIKISGVYTSFYSDMESIPFCIRRIREQCMSLVAAYRETSKAKVAPVVYLTPDLIKNPDFTRLSIVYNNISYIFIELPYTRNLDWLTPALHSIVFSMNLRPVFVRFERYVIFYPEHIIKKLLSVPKASYIFTMSFIDGKRSRQLFSHMVKANIPVFVGSSSHEFKRIERFYADSQREIKELLGTTEATLYELRHNNFLG